MKQTARHSRFVVALVCGAVLLPTLAGCRDPAVTVEGKPAVSQRVAPDPADGRVVEAVAIVKTDGSDIAKGKAIFAGKGHCSLCHAIGGDPQVGRGPDLADIGARAVERAKQFGIEGPQAAEDYLVRSVVRPYDDVVEGYNPAPESWLASGLTDDDIRHLVGYLKSLGGMMDLDSVALPVEWLAAKRNDYQCELALFSFGDPEKGNQLFHDLQGKAGCVKCHKIDGQGKETCPDLTSIVFVQRPSYIFESILNSSAFIVHGYRQTIILDLDGRVHTGLTVKEDEETITLVIDQEGRTESILKEDIDEQQASKVSIMPAGYAKELSAGQVMDLVAYLLKHKPPEPNLVETEPQPRPLAQPLSLDVFGPISESQNLYRTAMERGDPLVGARIYAHYCVMCHGPTGDGGGFNAVNLATKPANHTDDRRMSKTEDLLLHGVITRGGDEDGPFFPHAAVGRQLDGARKVGLDRPHPDLARRSCERFGFVGLLAEGHPHRR